MQNSKILKVVTLTGFVSMLGAFVAYRSGAFDKADAQVAILNNGDYIAMPVDSPNKPLRMSSSKAGPVFEDRQSTSRTSTATTTQTVSPDVYMPSSKSAGFATGKDVADYTFTADLNPPSQKPDAKKKNEAQTKPNNSSKSSTNNQINSNNANNRINANEKPR